MAKKKKEVCPTCGKSFVYLNRHKCKEGEKGISDKREKLNGGFRGVQIPDIEVNCLQELESQLKIDFKVVENITVDTKMGFTVEDNRVSTLGLYDCGLSTLPESIGNLHSLQVITLANNKLTKLPDSFWNLKSLKVLSMIGNQFTTLPESLGNLSSLHILSLDSNQLSTLPESIGNLSSLEVLWCIKNQLKSLPESIGTLKSLKQLWISDNKLKALPDSIGNLTSLEILWLNGNQLSTLPESLCSLIAEVSQPNVRIESLHTLGLAGNNLTMLPETITKPKQMPLSGSGMNLPDGTIFVHESISPNDIKPPIKVFLDDENPVTFSEAIKRLKQEGVKFVSK